MIWNEHSTLEGKHCCFSPSSPSFLRYTDEKIFEYLGNLDAAERGTKDHEFAALCINRRQRLMKSPLSQYVNDAIGFKMIPEKVLCYGNLFGTTDAICYNEKTHFLRIHDLKTGISKVHEDQLRVYAALFFLEYGFRPEDGEIELRFYQRNDILTENPAPEKIREIMEFLVHLNKQIDIYYKEKAGNAI